jgi:GAF domain-containing protein
MNHPTGMTPGESHENTAETFAQFALELYEAPSLADTAETAVSFALHALDCHHAGLALAVHGVRLEIVAATAPVVEALYRFQIDTSEGPALQALAGRTTVSVTDVATETRWPRWAYRAHAAGISSVLHIPMTTATTTVGVLSLFSAEPHAFSADDEAIAYLLAQHASVAVADARRDETMTQAVDARRLVGQAMGILMERFHIDEDGAFAVLKRYSQDTNTKLRDVAQRLIETRRLPH